MCERGEGEKSLKGESGLDGFVINRDRGGWWRGEEGGLGETGMTFFCVVWNSIEYRLNRVW
jgi:hypothetical protein